MKLYLCKKDWIINDRVYYQKDKHYKGSKQKKGVKMYGENNMKATFHEGSDYFDIK